MNQESPDFLNAPMYFCPKISENTGVKIAKQSSVWYDEKNTLRSPVRQQREAER